MAAPDSPYHDSEVNVLDSADSTAPYVEALFDTGLFAELPEDAAREIAPSLRHQTLPAGARVDAQAHDGVHLIVDGAVQARWRAPEGDVLGTLRRGDLAGDDGEGPAVESLLALEETTLASLDRVRFEAVRRRLETQDPGALAAVRRRVVARRLALTAGRSRPAAERLLEHLRASPLLAGVDPDALAELERRANWVYLPSRQVLLQQGLLAGHLYLVVHGRLAFRMHDDNGRLAATGEYRPGEWVGEVAFVSKAPLAATVYSTRDTQLLEIESAGFDALVRRAPAVMFPLTRAIIRRAEASLKERHTGGRFANLALVPLTADVPLDAVSRGLAQALPGPVHRVDRVTLEGRLGPGATRATPGEPAHTEILGLLSQLEGEAQHLILEADPAATPWTEHCLRAADRVLLLADATAASAAPSDWELRVRAAAAGDLAPGTELVIVHPATTPRASGAGRWLETRQVERHHHVRLGREDDMARLGRLLSGRSVGLVLGGGGAKGAAHIGVIRALGEAGIPIDLIGGTSAGAMIAGFHASGLDAAAMVELVAQKVANTNLINDYCYPRVSMVRGRKYSRFLREVYDDADIEDLWIGYFAAACNLTRGELEIIRSGPLWRSVRATTSLPGILPPALIGECLFVDGGILDNIPGEAMYQQGASRVIAVDVSPAYTPDVDLPYVETLERLGAEDGEAPSSWRVLAARMRGSPTSQALPGLGSLIVRSVLAGSRSRAQALEQRADVYVKLPVDEYSMFDYGAAPGLAQVGYEHALARVEAWSTRLAVTDG